MSEFLIPNVQPRSTTMHPENYQLKRGTALVIVGPQGCGKSSLAHEIARRHGKYQEIEAGAGFDFSSKDELIGGVKVLIINGVPSNDDMAGIKAIVTNPVMRVRIPFTRIFRNVATPLVIICTHDYRDAHWLREGSRRFDVIDLSAVAA